MGPGFDPQAPHQRSTLDRSTAGTSLVDLYTTTASGAPVGRSPSAISEGAQTRPVGSQFREVGYQNTVVLLRKRYLDSPDAPEMCIYWGDGPIV